MVLLQHHITPRPNLRLVLNNFKLTHENVAGNAWLLPISLTQIAYIPLFLIAIAIPVVARLGIQGRAGGGGYMAQRMLAARMKRMHRCDIVLHIAHYAIRTLAMDF